VPAVRGYDRFPINCLSNVSICIQYARVEISNARVHEDVGVAAATLVGVAVAVGVDVLVGVAVGPVDA
jgi:hypothetical protein